MAKGDWFNLLLAWLVTIPIVLMTMKAYEAGVNLKPIILSIMVVGAGLFLSCAWRRISRSQFMEEDLLGKD